MTASELEHDEAMRTFDEPQDTFNLMWATFYHNVLRDRNLISPAVLKGFCRLVANVLAKEMYERKT